MGLQLSLNFNVRVAFKRNNVDLGSFSFYLTFHNALKYIHVHTYGYTHNIFYNHLSSNTLLAHTIIPRLQINFCVSLSFIHPSSSVSNFFHIYTYICYYAFPSHMWRQFQFFFLLFLLLFLFPHSNETTEQKKIMLLLFIWTMMSTHINVYVVQTVFCCCCYNEAMAVNKKSVATYI